MESPIELQNRAEWLYNNTPYCCAESVLKSLLEYFQIPHEESLIKAAAGFGGGMGSSGCACGTISGSVMAIGYIMNIMKWDYDGKQVKAVTHKVFQHFKDEHKVPCCRLLTRDYKNDEKLKKQTCTKYVSDMAYFTALCLEEAANNKGN